MLQRRIQPKDLMSQAAAATLEPSQLKGRACLLCAAPVGRVALYPVGRIDGVRVFVCDCVGGHTVRQLQAGGEIRLAAGEINAALDEGE